MKKIFVVACCSFLSFIAIAQKTGGAPLSPGICTCDGFAVSTNMWIEGNATTFSAYILELQIPQVTGCTVALDSLFFLTIPGGLAQERFNAFTEFVKVQDKISSDKKWHTLRYRIPKRLFAHAPVLNQPLSIFYKTRVGTRVCTPTSNIKITDELL